MESGPVSVYHAANSSEAHLISGLLRVEGIESQVTGENQAYAGLSTAMPIKVMVLPAEAERARAVIAAKQAALPDAAEVAPETRETELPTELATVQRLSLRENWLEAAVVLSMVAYFYFGLISQWFWPESYTGYFWSVEWNVGRLSEDLPIIFMTLFLMQQSGKSWTEFGVVRPRLLVDVPLGGCIWMIDMVLWIFFASMLAPEAWIEPEASTDGGGFWVHALAVGVICTGAFMEELLLRCYLITRLEQVFRSSVMSVLVSTMIFAGYHSYQGSPGLLSAGIMGLLFGGMFCLVRRVWPITLSHMLVNLMVYWQLQVG